MSKYHRRSPHENKQAALNAIIINREKNKTTKSIFQIKAAKDHLEKKLNVIDSFAQEHEVSSTKGCVISLPNLRDLQVASTVTQSPLTWK